MRQRHLNIPLYTCMSYNVLYFPCSASRSWVLEFYSQPVSYSHRNLHYTHPHSPQKIIRVVNLIASILLIIFGGSVGERVSVIQDWKHESQKQTWDCNGLSGWLLRIVLFDAFTADVAAGKSIAYLWHSNQHQFTAPFSWDLGTALLSPGAFFFVCLLSATFLPGQKVAAKPRFHQLSKNETTPAPKVMSLVSKGLGRPKHDCPTIYVLIPAL